MKENVLLAAIILAAAVIAAALILRYSGSPTCNAAPCNSSQRYQVSVGANHAIMVDTSTGRAWQTYLPSHTGRSDDDFHKVKLNTEQ